MSLNAIRLLVGDEMTDKLDKQKPTTTSHESGIVYPAPGTTCYPVYAVSRYKGSRHWAIYDPHGALVCVALYRKGAREVAKRLNDTLPLERREQDAY
jgi:hypothetical protein